MRSVLIFSPNFIVEAILLALCSENLPLAPGSGPLSNCNNGDIRLVDGQDEFHGRVEMCHSGEWKTVCDTGWGMPEAKVVCRQLGYPADSIGKGEPLSFGQVNNSPILFDSVICNSSYSKLSQCVDIQIAHIGIFRCDHIAGVTCPDIPNSSTMASDVSLTTEESSTETTQLPSRASSTQQSVVVGIVGGLLVVVAVTVVSITVPVAALMMKRKRKNDFYVGKDNIAIVDNPAYDCHIMMPSNKTDYIRDFESPLYSGSTVQSQVLYMRQ